MNFGPANREGHVWDCPTELLPFGQNSYIQCEYFLLKYEFYHRNGIQGFFNFGRNEPIFWLKGNGVMRIGSKISGMVPPVAGRRRQVGSARDRDRAPPSNRNQESFLRTITRAASPETRRYAAPGIGTGDVS